MIMLKNNLHKVLLVVMACFLVLVTALPVSAAGTKKNEPGMLTPPPPDIYKYPSYGSVTGGTAGTGGDVSINSMNPGDIYLNYGVSDIGYDPNNSKAVFSGTTHATQLVGEVGIMCELQRWTGSSWVTVATTEPTKWYNNYLATITASSSNWSKGYYYRTYSTHWVLHNGTRETGYSASHYTSF